MRTSVAALSCVAHLYCRTATITHSSAMPDNTPMRNTDDIRTPSLSIVLFLPPGEARIRIPPGPRNDVALELEACRATLSTAFWRHPPVNGFCRPPRLRKLLVAVGLASHPQNAERTR